ncbi:MAG: MFS transporter [Actinomycetota bacterium]
MPRTFALRPAPVLFAAMFASQAALLTLSPLLTEVAAEFATNPEVVGQLRSISGLSAGVVAVWLALGRAHRWPLRSMLLTSLLLLAGGAALSAAAPGLVLLTIAQLPTGAGVAIALSAALAAAGAWASPAERTRVLSWALAGQPIAWVVGMPLIGAAAASDWRLAFVVVPFAASLVALALVSMHPRDEHKPSRARCRDLWGEHGVKGWALGELLAYSAWSAALVYAGALFAESYGLSVSHVSLVLAAGATAYVPGTFLFRRWTDRWARVLLIGLGALSSLAMIAFGSWRPSPLASLAVFALLAFLAGGRSLAGAAAGLDAAPGHNIEIMGVRSAALQFGYVVGAGAGGLAISMGGYPALGVLLGVLYAAATVPHIAATRTERAELRSPAELPRAA